MNRREFLKLTPLAFTPLLLRLEDAMLKKNRQTTPETFAQTITDPSIRAGEAIEMRGGIYTGNFNVTIGGMAGKPIKFRPYIGESVTVEGSLSLSKGFTEWRNVSIHQPDTTKTCLYMTQSGTRVLDADISGGRIGVEWFGSGAGSLVRCNVRDTASYGIYTHNNNGGLREITDCTFTNIGGYYGMHFYSDANIIKDYIVKGCTVDKPTIVHSGREVSNVNFYNNRFNKRLKIGNGFSDVDTRQVVVSGNKFIGEDARLEAQSYSDLEVIDNEFAVLPTVQFTNVYLLSGNNLRRVVIDRNSYIGGVFNINNAIINFSQWQAAGYDINGIYS